MDPVAHTLVGAALGKAGLERRTPLAIPALLIGANLPDMDVGAYALGETFALSFRRGWTHGVLAMVVLPLVLTGGLLAWDRFVRRARDPAGARASGAALLFVSFVAVLSHPLLDLLNVYGIRLLMPFSARWFYGDALFIVDPWFWAVLAVGIVAARRAGRPGPARAALAVLVAYVAVMAASGAVARTLAVRSAPFARAGIERALAAPVPVTPFQRWIVLDEGDRYLVGEFDWLGSPRVRYGDLIELPRGADQPAVARIAGDRAAREFLSWARFPFYRVRDAGSGVAVEIIDARYAVEADVPFGALTVWLDP